MKLWRGIPRNLEAVGALAAIAFSPLLPQTHAALISPDTAVASSYFAEGYNPERTIDGSGLPAGFTAASAHDDYVIGNHWTSVAGSVPTQQFIVWGFSVPQTLNAIYIWNHRSTPSHAANSQYDVTLFDLTLFDSSDTPLLTWSGVALNPDTATAQTFSFGGAIEDVAKVRFDIKATQGSTTYTGLAEVAFNTGRGETSGEVPEPSTYALVGGGLALAALLRRAR